ncbi:MAG: sulfatase-like hydrolase/transferase, partial [Clostridia bacterium]|nr:sulfatase-like hydrolase/transferase [Clostridia bacterium]
MFNLILITVSFASLLLLLMPANSMGIISTAAVLALGVCLIIFKKAYKTAFLKNKQYYLFALAALMVSPFGIRFYNRWLPSSKVEAVASKLHISGEALLITLSILLSVLSVYCIYAVLQTVIKRFSETDSRKSFIKSIISAIISAAFTVMLVQVMVDADAFSMGWLKFLWGVLILSVMILFIYCLLGRILLSVILGSGIFMIISTINVYVYSFRERLFEPIDIFSAGTAMNVAENYSLFPIPAAILAGLGAFAAMVIVLYFLHNRSRSKPAAKGRCILAALCIIGTVATLFYAADLKTYHWHNEGAKYNGYVLDFVSKFKEISVSEPENYSIDDISKTADKYAADPTHKTEDREPAHIIVIMDEAFSDLGVIGEISTNKEVMPFISSLKENTVSGYALSSVYGGNTANSEYEFLTGNSMAWLSPNAVPYQQHIRSSTYSMVSYLKSSYNYKCVAMHPFESSGWNRPSAYGYLGFDECYFIESFPQDNLVRKYISDQEMFEYLIETYEAQKEDQLFIFGVTMQNHGGYTYTGENYTRHISINDPAYADPEVEQYLSLIHETDKAVEYLISYFQNADDNVVIVFFGDHQPKINESFYEAVSGTAANTLDEQQKRYEVPFFIWANYDIEEKHIDNTSLNYLSSYVYDVAGLTLPAYNNFLGEMEKVIPSINANGFYS